jgi:LysM repeat protein
LLSWSYQATANDSLASVAKTLGVTAEDLAKLNDLSADAKLKKGQELQIPGNYDHQINEYNSYLMLGRIQNSGRVNTPYEPRSVKNRIHQIKKGEDLAAIAKKYQITEELLRNINELEADEEYTGDRILVEYSVQPLKTATLADIALAFNVPVENLLKTNGYASEDEFDASKRVQIPYGKRMGLQNQRAGANSVSVYEVALGNKEFKKIEDKYAVPDTSLIKPATSLFNKLKSAVQGITDKKDK